MDLSPQEVRILGLIRAHTGRLGYPPTLREIAQALHLKSHSTVHHHIAKLKRKGYLTSPPRFNRALHLTGGPYDQDPA